jgi:superfamily II DNA or RNA helicase
VSKLNKPLVLVVTNSVIYIDGVITSEIYQGLKRVLRYRPEDYYFRVKQFEQKQRSKGRKWSWDGWVNLVCRDKRWCRCFLKKDGIHFATGLYSVAMKHFADNGIPVKVIDKRKKYDKNLFLKMSKECENREYQTGFVESCVDIERGVTKAATGSGKTFMGAKIIQQIGVAPFIFYVPSIDLLNQTKDEFEKFLRHKNGKKIKIGMIGDGRFDPKDITIMTVQTAVRACGGKYIKYDDEDKNIEDNTLDNKRRAILGLIMSAKGIFCDEIQHWACEMCQTIADYSVAARYRIGASATPFRDKNDDILITSCFGKDIVGANISASDLIKSGYLVKPNIYFVDIPGHNEGYTYQTIYKKYIVENKFRNEKITKVARSMMEAGNVVLILVRQITHGKMLESMLPDSVFLYSKHSGKKRKQHLDLMRTGAPSITITTSIFDEGINCKALNTLILAGSGKSPTRSLQRIGRTLRPFTYDDGRKKEFSTVIDFMDNYKYLLSHSRARKKMYRTEPEFSIEDLDT